MPQNIPFCPGSVTNPSSELKFLKPVPNIFPGKVSTPETANHYPASENKGMNFSRKQAPIKNPGESRRFDGIQVLGSKQKASTGIFTPKKIRFGYQPTFFF